jgi:pilus assembly protein CpaC
MQSKTAVHLFVGRIVRKPALGTRLCRARIPAVLAVWALFLAFAGPLSAQRIFERPEKVLTISKGASLLLENPGAIQRFSIGEPDVAEATVLSPREVLISGKEIGVTTLLVWGSDGIPKLYSVEVTADAAGLERYLKEVLPNQEVTVSASGNTVTLSGQVRDPSAAARAVEIAKGSGAVVIDNLSIPTALQVQVKVWFAEANRNALEEWSSRLSTVNPHELSDDGRWAGATQPGASEDNISFSLINPGSSFTAGLRALKARGDFKALAEPTLLTLPGKEASFLAGGEFPYPTIQGGGGNNAVTIEFRSFGVMLKFTPTIMRNGNIRLKLYIEVSALDFANALQFQGFVIPSLTKRTAETEVELKDGQYLSLAGLINNSTLRNGSKIPILGDLPILGQLFRSKSVREGRTELLAIVSPTMVGAVEKRPAIPTGEVHTWDWSRRMQPKDTTARGYKNE